MVAFALAHYAALVLVLFACWGLGRTAFRLIPSHGRASLQPETALVITVGLGLVICLLQWLAIAGHLRRGPILVILALGAGLAVFQWLAADRKTRLLHALRRGWRQATGLERFALATLFLAVVSTLTAPLGPPVGWDEVMYHLPHARQWAESGHLEVTPWLRYPWFPYNYDLLYAASLVFGQDVFPHLMHACAGWLTAWLIFEAGRPHLGRTAAAFAACIWVLLVHGEFDNATIDMGVTLFVFAACVAFQQWRIDENRSRAWLAVSAFLLGVALGAKYQTLATAGFFGLAVLWRDRRPASWAVAAVALAVPCIYWYARNAVLTGDPFNPVGGRIFGFSDWNAGDLQGQFEDLRSQATWPPAFFWIIPLVLLFKRLRSNPVVQGAMVFCAYSIATWALSSGLPRYLMPAYPVLILLSVALLREVWLSSGASNHSLWTTRASHVAAYLVLLGLAWGAAKDFGRDSRHIAATPQAREAYLEQRIPGYGVLRYMQQHPQGKTYQLGVEYAIYYAPRPIWGDWFGPSRYRDFANLGAEDLHQALSRQGFDALIVNTKRFPGVTDKPGFGDRFERVFAQGPVHLFRIKKQ